MANGSEKVAGKQGGRKKAAKPPKKVPIMETNILCLVFNSLNRFAHFYCLMVQRRYQTNGRNSIRLLNLFQMQQKKKIKSK